ncbi:glycosyltransferase [Flavobacterium lacus]|uniref:Glycosyltransferase involved in cell wall biosynthesis n=1 Tax=Flavobacterium lacus TaxID=1353778 RepID=A0A328X0N1_9FLAO|nr:glycosyltransferase [Flavobacterium lacus]RAR51145.1 glycosyltransferase involved in cell wall biosynthesis [Flavobacterium lacus]
MNRSILNLKSKNYTHLFMTKTKKKILFIINNLNCGGAENALVSLLQVFDYQKYDVDLLLMKNEGVFLKKLPKEVQLLPAPQEIAYFDMSIKTALLESLTRFRLDIVLARLVYFFYVKNEPVPTIKDQKLWRVLRTCLPKLPQTYDVAISYLENIPNCYNVDKVTSTKKIAFIRNDYAKLGMDPALDRPYFKQLTALLTVSKSCEAILHKLFSDLPIHIGTMQSVFSLETIKVMAEEPIQEDFSGITIVSVGRLYPQKGFDLAIAACSLLVQRGYALRWFILGEGSLRNELQQQINALQLADHFFLIGQKENPYPYLQKASIYAQTSRFEGKSRATEEAKILQKIILATNFPTVSDQLTHLENGYIVDLNAEAIAEGIIQLLENDEIGVQLKRNLSTCQIDNEQELKILYNLIEK